MSDAKDMGYCARCRVWRTLLKVGGSLGGSPLICAECAQATMRDLKEALSPFESTAEELAALRTVVVGQDNEIKRLRADYDIVTTGKADLRAMLDAEQEANDAHLAEIERLREALQFYANPETYYSGAFVHDIDEKAPGRRARAALEGK